MLTENNELLCPACKQYTGTHLKGVDLYNARTDENRMSTVLEFECECGHKFDVDVRQHEGMTLFAYLEGGETDDSE